jgi:hypothetical protein
MHWDPHWKLWTWQRFQQLVGAALVAVPISYFLLCLAKGQLPADFDADISTDQADHREIDHTNIAYAIGSCHLSGNVSTWSPDWLRTLRISSLNIVTPAATAEPPQANVQAHDTELTAFERAALWQSSRIIKERERFLHEAEERQNRARLNQLRILCLSAAAAFLVALKALAASKDEDTAFRSLMKGAVMPISVFALLMPVLATAVSGVATFDGDPNVVVRHIRTLSQLEQLHGRIAEDVTSDPYLCPMVRASSAVFASSVAPTASDRGVATNPVRLNECLMDRMARTVAWEQRHEQILNDATPSLAHAGDLPRSADKQHAAAAAPGATKPLGDSCAAAFAHAVDVAALAAPASNATPAKVGPAPL